jgi:hypothetical protein
LSYTQNHAADYAALIAYVYPAGGVVLLAIIIYVMTRFDAQAWITKDLKRGDLHSLIDVASGLRPDGLTRDQASRLQARGMVRPYGKGNFSATMRGRVALFVRQKASQ